MDFNRLRYFTTVARTGSLRAAAELLRVSPAAISKAMRVLEDEMGVDLIQQVGRGIILTAEGRGLVSRADQLLRDIDTLKVDLRTAAVEMKRHLRIASFEVFTTYFVGALLEDKDLQSMELLLHEFVPGHMEQSIVDHICDIGITYIPIPTQGVEHIKAASIKMGIFGRADIHGKLPFSQWPFAIPITPVHGSPTKVLGLDGWPEDKVPRLVQYRLTMMESALEIVRRGMGVIYLPTFVAKLHNAQVRDGCKLQALPPPAKLKSLEQPVYLVYRKGEGDQPVLKKIAKALRQTCST